LLYSESDIKKLRDESFNRPIIPFIHLGEGSGVRWYKKADLDDYVKKLGTQKRNIKLNIKKIFRMEK
jgi:hypothetical protein